MKAKIIPLKGEKLEARIQANRIHDRLETLACKADLVAMAIQGEMALADDDQLWPIQDAAFEIKQAIEEIAKEVAP